MKKQIMRFKVPYSFNWTYGVEIKKLREDLDELEKLGVTTIDIEAEENYGSAFVSIEAYTNRLETDEEYKERIKLQKKMKQQEEIRDLRELERLKLKYNK